MCGICGLLYKEPRSQESFYPLIDQMTDTIEHRGPDDRGTWCNARVGLGSRRLSVIDLSSAGHMPMGNEDGSVQIAYNGEVYNFRELRKRFALDQRGHVFRSNTDTEVLVHLYEELGMEMLRELNGMFAIAIWDERQQALHLARDRYGIKPLFYQQDRDCFRFGSEIKTILADHRVSRVPSVQALHDFLTFDYVPGAQTAFDGIDELPPAHWMTIHQDGTRTLERYWDLMFDPDFAIDERTAIERSGELMDQAVKRRLIADVPIGVLLSGGMDSSVIVALMDRHVNEQVRTYSVGFEDESFNELPYARIIAEHFNTIHREVMVTPQKVRDMLPDYLRYIDEPYADGSAIPTYYVCQLAKDEVTVVLSGEGGDEAFSGYETYTAFQASQMFSYIPRWVQQTFIAPVVNRLPVSDKKLSLEFKLKRFLGGQGLTSYEAHLWWRIVLTEPQKQGIYSDDLRQELAVERPIRHFEEAFLRQNAKESLSGLMYVDSSVFLPDDLMIKNDRMSMAHSLEARVPFTDPELVEFLARVPSKLKMPRMRKKHLMRSAMEGVLPESILNKKKVGLEMPYSRWFKDELNDLLLDHLSPTRLRNTGFFEPSGVGKLVEDHLQGRADHGRALWGLLNFMMWHDLYITSPASSHSPTDLEQVTIKTPEAAVV